MGNRRSNVGLTFKADAFLLCLLRRSSGEACEFLRLQRAITALCTLVMLSVIFHNHPNPTKAPHPFRPRPHQYLPLIRPPLPSLPLGRRHLYSGALCLATSAGAAILDRGAHHFNVNKSDSPWAPLE